MGTKKGSYFAPSQLLAKLYSKLLASPLYSPRNCECGANISLYRSLTQLKMLLKVVFKQTPCFGALLTNEFNTKVAENAL